MKTVDADIWCLKCSSIPQTKIEYIFSLLLFEHGGIIQLGDVVSIEPLRTILTGS